MRRATTCFTTKMRWCSETRIRRNLQTLNKSILLRSEIPSGICAKLRTAYAQSFAFTCHDHSIIACSLHIYVWCCSSRTSRPWRTTQSTQHHRRGCNIGIIQFSNFFLLISHIHSWISMSVLDSEVFRWRGEMHWEKSVPRSFVSDSRDSS